MEEVLEEKVNENDSRLEFIFLKFNLKEVGKLDLEEFIQVISENKKD